MRKTIFRSGWLVMATLMCVLLCQGTVKADTVLLNDNFNAENGGVGVLNYNGFANWTVTNGTVDLIGNGYYDFYQGNGLYVDLDGSTGKAGTMSTTQSFNPGSYKLEFDLGGNARGGADDVYVTFGSFSDVFFGLSSNVSLTTHTYAFTTTGGQLSFQNTGGDNVGAILDNVKLSQVPEPATLFLLGVGLLGLAGLKKRHIK